jgi:hypothetical protein
MYIKKVNERTNDDGLRDETEAEFRTYNFVEVSGHNLEISHTWGFRIQCLQKALKIFVPNTSKNLASGFEGIEGCCEMGG